MQNINIDFEKIKKKLEIENNLLEQINQELSYNFEELKIIYNNSKWNSFDKIDSIDNLINLSKILRNDYIDYIDNIDKLDFIKKIFDHVNKTYWSFQYFFIKKKDFMGMNLTGILSDKVETGLSFRNCIQKITFETLKKKYNKLYELLDNDLSNYEIYKLKSDNMDWNEFSITQKYKYFYIINKIDSKEYYIFGEL